MYFHLVLLNIYFRFFVFLLNPKNLWHWRLPVQGILQDIIAAGVIYLIFRILWIFIRPNPIRKIVFFSYVFLWTLVNFANYQYADTFNKLLPLSWFSEIGNVGAMGSMTELISDYLNLETLFQVIFPLLVSAYLVFKHGKFLFRLNKVRSIIYVFIISVVCQSASLDPGIQPMWDSTVHSHLLKYWYFDYDRQPFPKIRTEPLPDFSEMFNKVILEKKPPLSGVVPTINHTKPNVVFLMLESFRAFETGTFGSQLNLTPNFDRYAQKGILFTNIYSTANLTKIGQWSLLCGSFKHRGSNVMTDHQDHASKCIPDLLAEEGYDNWWFHGQSASYDFQGYFMKHHQVEHIMDRLTFPIETKALGWGLPDEALMGHALKHLDMAKQPFFWLVQTQSNHHPFEVPPRFKKKRDFPNTINKYLNTFNYTDYTLGLFLDRFLRTPQGKNSLIIITADHGVSKTLSNPLRSNKNKTLLKYHLPLLLLYPESMAVKPARINTLGGQPDLMPTLMDILGIPVAFPVFGRSLVRDYHNRFAKGMVEGQWLLREDKMYMTHPTKLLLTHENEPLTITAEDELWFNLTREIDDVQDWMVQQTDFTKMVKGLAEKGWIPE